jgi:hypothetical protein
VHKKALIAAFCLLALCAGAQENKEMLKADSPTAVANILDEIRIEGFVPDFLKISLDFAADNSAALRGYYPSEAAANNAADPSVIVRKADKTFSIHPGQVVDLGMAVLISNVVGPYTISVFSANGGQLASSAPDATVGIPYSLGLGDQLTRAQAGVFYFTGSGRSHAGGIRLNVCLIFDQLKPPLPHSAYTDELSFVVSAN